MNETYALLEEIVNSELANLGDIEDYDEVAKRLKIILELYTMMEKESIIISNFEKDKLDRELKFREDNLSRKEIKLDRYVRIGTIVFEVTAPLVFYGIWMNRGFRFEEKGVFTSNTFRGLFSRFRTTK